MNSVGDLRDEMWEILLKQNLLNLLSTLEIEFIVNIHHPMLHKLIILFFTNEAQYKLVYYSLVRTRVHASATVGSARYLGAD